MSCLNFVKNQLTKILYPSVESFSETGNTANMNPLLQRIVKNPHSMSSVHRRQLGELSGKFRFYNVSKVHHYIQF